MPLPDLRGISEKNRAALRADYTRLVKQWKGQCAWRQTSWQLAANVFRGRYNKKDRADSQACSTLRASNSSARVLPRFTAAIGIPARAAVWTKRKPE